MPTTYSLLPVTRIATTPRAHADITLGFSKRGDLSLIFSPAFLAEHAALGVGSKVLIAYSAEAKKLLIAPPSAEQKEHLRMVRKRATCSSRRRTFPKTCRAPKSSANPCCGNRRKTARWPSTSAALRNPHEPRPLLFRQGRLGNSPRVL